LTEAFEAPETAGMTPDTRIACSIVKIAWMGLFEIYYWLCDRECSTPP
jgi:hypothetical protein